MGRFDLASALTIHCHTKQSPNKVFGPYAVSSCYRKIFNVKSNENVRICMDMFNCDDVATLLTKRKQKFAGILPELAVYCANW